MSAANKASTNKAVQKVVDNMVKQGWVIEHRPGHAKLRSPCGRWAIPIARTPRNDNSAKQLMRDIKKVQTLSKGNENEQ